MTESKGFDMEALQNMMSAWVDEVSIKQKEDNTKQTEELKENINDKLGGITENLNEVKQENVQLKEELNQNINKQIKDLNNKLGKLKQELIDSTMQLADKIRETNTRIEMLETSVEQSLNEQALKMENRFKEQKAEWSKELKDSVNQVAERWNEKFIVAKQVQDMERKAVSEQVHENINKTQELLSLIHI